MDLDVGIGTDAHGEFSVKKRAEVGVDIETPKTMLHDHFVKASAELLPLRTKSFETVFAFNLLEHVPNPRQALSELVRVGGIVQIRQDRWFNIASYATPSHLWFQRRNLNFLPYPRTPIGILFSKWLRAMLMVRVEWKKGRIFTLSPLLKFLFDTGFQERLIAKTSVEP